LNRTAQINNSLVLLVVSIRINIELVLHLMAFSIYKSVQHFYFESWRTIV